MFRVSDYLDRHLRVPDGNAPRRRGGKRDPTGIAAIAASADPFAALREWAANTGGGAWIGTWRDHPGPGWPDPWFADREDAVLVLGPPRWGKTQSIIIPSVIAAPGPVVSTSTKLDVFRATEGARRAVGAVWVFNPARRETLPPGVNELRWSPLLTSITWGGALRIARAMAATPGEETPSSKTEDPHWKRRASRLLAPLCHAAALADRSMVDILDWLQNEDIDTAGEILAAHPTNTARAEGALTGIGNTPERERGSIFGTALSLLDAYESHEALDAASDPNLDAAAFVRSTDTIYIAAPAEDQALTAPLVVGLLDDIRRAAYERQRQIDTGAEAQQWPVTMALDELANIAPIHDLKSMVSEGGSQGLHIIASFQDLGQIRARWGEHLADAALTLFGRKVILGGIGDTKTLEAISLMLNEFDRHIVTETANKGWTPVWGSTSMTTQRQRNWTPGGIREIAKGEALYLWQNNWTRMVLTDYSQHVPWPQVMASIQEHAAPSSQRP